MSPEGVSAYACNVFIYRFTVSGSRQLLKIPMNYGCSKLGDGGVQMDDCSMTDNCFPSLGLQSQMCACS